MDDEQDPRGKLTRDDEGELDVRIVLSPDRRTLVLAFGKPVAWMGLGTRSLDDLMARLTAARENMIEDN